MAENALNCYKKMKISGSQTTRFYFVVDSTTNGPIDLLDGPHPSKKEAIVGLNLIREQERLREDGSQDGYTIAEISWWDRF